MNIRVAAKSDSGLVREINEDCFYADSSVGLFVVCGGMGGHVAGEVASQKAIEFAVEYLHSEATARNMPIVSEFNFHDSWNQLVNDTMTHVCEQLIQFAKRSPEFDGMATTMTLLLLVENVAFVGHIGDSRLYLKHLDTAEQLTNDHTLFEEFVREDPNLINLNSDLSTIRRFERVLTRCVGRQSDVEVDSFNFQLVNQDVLLLCTDGLSRYFSHDHEIVGFLDIEDPDTCVENLIEFANESGGRDNITAIVIRIADITEIDFANQTLFSGPGLPTTEHETSEWLPSELV